MRLARVILVIAGLALAAAGAAAVGVGILHPEWISSQLPPDAEVDAPAVGGAAVALGAATIFLAAVHVGTALALRSGVGIVATGAVTLAATMAILSLGFGIAALVSIASGEAPALYMLPAAIGLGVAVIGYAGVTVAVLGARGRPV